MPEHTIEFGTPAQPAAPDGRLDAAAFHRNHEPIWTALSAFLQGRRGDVLEVGSGTGQHAAEFARRIPDIVWWPTDANERHLRSIAAWQAQAGLANLRRPGRLDLADPDWRPDRESDAPAAFLAILCINVLHIAPWRVAENLLAGAGRLLRPDGRLFVYGPFMRDGSHTAPSNAAFDQSLRRENPEWGVRDIADLDRLARRHGLALADTFPMPAHNLVLAFALAG